MVLGVALVPALSLAGSPAARTSVAQLSGKRGCVAQESDADVCAKGKALIGAGSVVVSPDGRNVYVGSAGESMPSGGIAVFARAGTDGTLTQQGCVTNDGGDGRADTDGACADGDALAGDVALAVSADGENVYAASPRASGIAALRRDAAGGLSPVGCVRENKLETRCADGRALVGAAALAVSPDGRNVYVASPGSNAVASFARDDTGALSEIGCISQDGTDGACVDGAGLVGPDAVAVSPDGRSVYVAAYDSNAITTFDRDPASGALRQAGCVKEDPPAGPCRSASAIESPTALAVSPDGRTLYVTAEFEYAVVAFVRDTATGALREPSCIHVPGESESAEEASHEDDPQCRSAKGLVSPESVAISADGRSVFVASEGSNSLTAFARDPADGGLAQTDCVSDDGEEAAGCADGAALESAGSVAVSPDGANVYVAAPGSNAVSVFAPAAAVTTAGARLGRTGAVGVRVACAAWRRRACTGDVRLVRLRQGAGHRRPGRIALTAARRFRLRPGAVGAVRLHVSRATRRLAARRRVVAAMAVVRDHTGATRPAVTKLRLRLR